MNQTEIKNNYNVVKIVFSKELLILSRSYKDNLDTIIVMMKRKVKINQPPQWFVDYMDMFKVNFKKEIEQVIDKKLNQKFKDFAKLNNLKIS